MKNKFKKITYTTILIMFSFFAILPPATGHVQAAEWYNPTFEEYTAKVFDPNSTEIYGERYTHAQVVWIIYSMISMIFPEWMLKCIPPTIEAAPDPGAMGIALGTCVGEYVVTADSSVLSPQYADVGAPPTLSSIGSAVFLNNPMSGTGYLYQKAQMLDLVDEVYAQDGFGYTTLQPVQTLWTGVRNITYFLLILAAIIMAFMIMFRTKTSPQTVITVQSAIPKLIIALILITFSYAIAGFIIDLAYIVVGLLAIAITDVAGGNITTFDSALKLYPALLDGVSALGSVFIVLAVISLAIVIAINLAGVGAAIIFPGAAAALVGLFQGSIILTLIFLAVILIFLLIIWIRAIWTMVKAFINIIILTIVSPIMILMGVLPGYGGFGAWVRAYAAQVAVFPVIITMMFFSHYFLWSFATDIPLIGELLNLLGDNERLNPYQIDINGGVAAGGITLPGFNFGTALINFFGALGFLFLIPHAANMIKSVIERQPFPYGSAIGQPLGTAGTMGRAAYGRYVSPATQWEMGRQIMAGEGRVASIYNRLPGAERLRRGVAENVFGFKPSQAEGRPSSGGRGG